MIRYVGPDETADHEPAMVIELWWQRLAHLPEASDLLAAGKNENLAGARWHALRAKQIEARASGYLGDVEKC